MSHNSVILWCLKAHFAKKIAKFTDTTLFSLTRPYTDE